MLLHISSVERLAHAIAHILMVNEFAVVLCHRNGLSDFADQLFGLFVHAHHRKVRIVGTLIKYGRSLEARRCEVLDVALH